MQLYYGEMQDIQAEIEAGDDVRQIVQARRGRQHPAADQTAVHELAGLRSMVMQRLAQIADEHEPWPGPLLLPCEVDFGQVDMLLYIWTGILYGVTLAQNTVDGDPATAGRPIPAPFSLWDAQLPQFWHGDPSDAQDPPDPIGNWPAVLSAAPGWLAAGAA